MKSKTVVSGRSFRKRSKISRLRNKVGSRGYSRRYSRRIIMLRCIFVETYYQSEGGVGTRGFVGVLTTVPVRILPRMDTCPVKGHFLSANEC